MPSPDRRLLATLDRLTPQMRRDVTSALEALRRSVTLPALIEAIVRQDEVAIYLLTQRFPKSFTKAGETLRKAFTAGASTAAKLVPNFTLTATNPLATAAAERTAAAMVTGVSRETRKAIRTIVVEAFKDGLSPRQTAQLIKPLIGLTERQALAVLRQRRLLQASGKTAAQVKQALDRYTATLLRQRAEMIARTEIIRASTDGKVEAWRQAKAQGRLGQDLRTTWIVTPDDKLCPICEPLDGAIAVIGGTFSVNGQSLSGPPAHPNCRCTVGLVSATKAARRVA